MNFLSIIRQKDKVLISISKNRQVELGFVKGNIGDNDLIIDSAYINFSKLVSNLDEVKIYESVYSLITVKRNHKRKIGFQKRKLIHTKV